jgi:hypothetical protein
MTGPQLGSIRIYFLIGIALAYISLFMDWYLFQGIDSSSAVIVDWSYHLFYDWYSPARLDTELNNWYKPTDASIPLPLIIFFVILLAIASFGAVFHSSENLSKMKHAKGFAIINLGVLFLIIFFMVIFPIMYLFPNQLLFPLLIFYDYELNLAFYFAVGWGYYLQVIAFVCCFPYCCLYYKLAYTFEIESQLHNFTNSPPNQLDLDKLIAEVELINRQQHEVKDAREPKPIKCSDELEAQEIYHQFLAVKNRRNRNK